MSYNDYNVLLYSKLDAEEKRLLRETIASCQICGRNPEKLQVEHDHETDTVRGIVCGQCNLRLGWVTALPLDWLRRAEPFLDDRAGAEVRTTLVQIVERHYQQRHSERLDELRTLQARQADLYDELDKTQRKLARLEHIAAPLKGEAR